MNGKTTTVELPTELYRKLTALAAEAELDVDDVIARLVEEASQRSGWLRNLRELREQIQANGGLAIGASKEAVVAQLRETRESIFDIEYAHLYR
jgi:hypothetical protein